MDIINFCNPPIEIPGTLRGNCCHFSQYADVPIKRAAPSNSTTADVLKTPDANLIELGKRALADKPTVLAFEWEDSFSPEQVNKLCSLVAAFRSVNKTTPIGIYGIFGPVPAGLAMDNEHILLAQYRDAFDSVWAPLWPLMRLCDYAIVSCEPTRWHRFRPERTAGIVQDLQVAAEQVARYKRLFPWLPIIAWTRPWFWDVATDDERKAGSNREVQRLMSPDELAFHFIQLSRITGVSSIGIWPGGDVKVSATVVARAVELVRSL